MGKRRSARALAISVVLTPALLTWGTSTSAAPVAPGGSPPLTKFTEQLPEPPVLDVTGADPAHPEVEGVVSLELDEVLARHSFHAALPPTPTFAYSPTGLTPANTFLGATIEAATGTPLRMTVNNELGDGTEVVHPYAAYFDESLPGAQQELEKRAVPTAVHLHGGHTPPDSDGGPDDTFYPVLDPSVDPADKAVPDLSTGDGQVPGSYTYEYPNDQDAAGLWIHDHALGATRLNPKSGLAAAYWLRDQWDTGDPGNALNLPTGKYELPIVLQDGTFNADGTFSYPTNTTEFHQVWAPESFGDVAIVNGKAWPNLDVDRGVYRFRVLNGSNARVYRLTLVDAKDRPATAVKAWQIGSDGGLLNTAVPLTNSPLVVAPGERADVLVDFSAARPGTYRFANTAPTPYPNGARSVRRGGAPLKDIMQFTVGTQPGHRLQTPLTLRGGTGQPPLIPVATTTGTQRTMLLNEIIDPATGTPVEVLLQNSRFHTEHEGEAAHEQMVVANPQLNTTEVWTLVNTTADTHPIHLHLTQFRVLNRQKLDSAAYLAKVSADIAAVHPGVAPLPDPSSGNKGTGSTVTVDGDTMPVAPDPTPFLRGAPRAASPGEAGWKDTVMAHPGEVVRILLPFGGRKAGLSAAFQGDAPTDPQRFVGTYVWHCHILEHEENDMMLAYRVRPL